MIVLNQIADERLWGGEKLIPLVEERHSRIGHLYTCISNKEYSSLILNGTYKGKTLKSYFDENKDRLGLSCFDYFPVVLALVDAKENLSIQVHPDDKIIGQYERANKGKNESWFFIESPPSGAIINGCKCKSKHLLRSLFESGDYVGAVDTLEVSEGSYVYCEAGTLHALTSGSLVFEIEENQDYTYRFYDYGRVDASGKLREMQMDKAIGSLDPEKKSISEVARNTKHIHRGYSFQLFEHVKSYKNCDDTIVCLTLLKGNAVVDGSVVGPGVTIIMESGEEIIGNLDVIAIVTPFTY